MTNLKWNRQKWTSTLDSEYWTNPKEGFDKNWHEIQNHKNIKAEKFKEFLGIHVDHELEKIQLTTGPHHGKLICKTCNNKFLKWLSKKEFN
jgi:hypothetical protein